MIPVTVLTALLLATGQAEATPAASPVFTAANERAAAFDGSGTLVVFVIRIGEYRNVMAWTERRAGRWQTPRVMPFAGPAADGDPWLSPDGTTLYFTSSRTAQGGPKRDLDLWRARREGEGWGAPEPVPGGANGEASERSPSLTRDGRLYFVSTRAGGSDVYEAGPDGVGGFGPARSVAAVNSDAEETAVAVSPDGSLMVVAAIGRPDMDAGDGAAYPRGDLYLSRRDGEGWTVPVRLAGPINTVADEGSPSFSADGRTLYFRSERSPGMDQTLRLAHRSLVEAMDGPRNGLGDIYAVPVSILEAAR